MPFRSLVFWLGLSVVAFIVWAGVDSAFFRTNLAFSRGSSVNWNVSNTCGRIVLQRHEIEGKGGVTSRFHKTRNLAQAVTRSPDPASLGHLFPLPAYEETTHTRVIPVLGKSIESIHIRSSLELPHWLLLLAFLPFWAALFCLRRRYLAARLRRSGVVEDEPAARPVPR